MSGHNITKKSVSRDEADGSVGDTTGKDDDSDSDGQQNVSESDSHSEGNLKRSRSTDDLDHDNAGLKRICLAPR